MEFFDRIKQLVKQNHTTIEALCSGIGLKKSTYQMMRHRGNLPTLDIAAAMAEALNVSLSYLAYGRDQEAVVKYFGVSDELQEYVKKFEKLEGKKRETIKELISGLYEAQRLEQQNKSEHA
jgi:transcriptional regulator with XRE-family HTH domain